MPCPSNIATFFGKPIVEVDLKELVRRAWGEGFDDGRAFNPDRTFEASGVSAELADLRKGKS
jgi:hypothetical protein